LYIYHHCIATIIIIIIITVLPSYGHLVFEGAVKSLILDCDEELEAIIMFETLAFKALLPTPWTGDATSRLLGQLKVPLIT
jgi:hypothetical protein